MFRGASTRTKNLSWLFDSVVVRFHFPFSFFLLRYDTNGSIYASVAATAAIKLSLLVEFYVILHYVCLDYS